MIRRLGRSRRFIRIGGGGNTITAPPTYVGTGMSVSMAGAVAVTANDGTHAAAAPPVHVGTAFSATMAGVVAVTANDGTHTAATAGNTLRVNGSTGSDSNTYAQVAAGTHKWATIGRALWGNATRPTGSWPGANQAEAATAGDTVLVEAGTYTVSQTTESNWTPIYQCVNDGTIGNPITIKSEGTVTLQHTAGTGESDGYPLIGCDASQCSTGNDYITWDGFVFDEANMTLNQDRGVAVVHGGFSAGQTCTGIRLINGTYNGTKVHTATNNWQLIRLEGGSDTSPATTAEVFNNTLSAHGRTSSDNNAAAIMIYGTIGVEIHQNTFDDNDCHIYMKGEYGAADYCQNLSIHHNIFKNSLKDGVVFQDLEGLDFYQNIMYDNYNSNFRIQVAELDAHPTDVKVYNNVFDDIVQTGSEFGNLRLGDPGTAPFSITGYQIWNNILVNADIGVNCTYWESGDYVHMVLKGNCYYNHTTAIGKFAGSNKATLAAWQAVGTGYDDGAGTTGDPASITSDPLFNTGTNVYTLQITSPCKLATEDKFQLLGGAATASINMGAYIETDQSDVIGAQ